MKNRERTRAPIVVADASVLVKTFRQEAGSQEALGLLAAHGRGDVVLVLPALAVEESLNVARRELGTAGARRVWEAICDTQAPIVPFDDAVAQAAFDACERLGCTFYDAVAAGLAGLVDGTLWSGDRKAHGGVPGATIVG